MQQQAQPDHKTCQTAACPFEHAARLLRRHGGKLIWVGLLALILAIQWPMLKGFFYKASGAPAPADGIAWRTDFDAALAEARQTGKPALLDFTADWCPPCKLMKHEVWPDAAVRRAVTDGTIPVLLDVDQPGSAQAARRYGVRAIPTLLLVDGDGNVLKRGNYMSKDALIRFIEEAA
jgi:protein disulfide-isomerase